MLCIPYRYEPGAARKPALPGRVRKLRVSRFQLPKHGLLSGLRGAHVCQQIGLAGLKTARSYPESGAGIKAPLAFSLRQWWKR
jgi:hypothetical protein